MRTAPISAPDPGLVWPQLARFSDGTLAPLNSTAGKTERAITIDPAKKTLVLIAVGQSLGTANILTNYTPANPTKLDNLNPQTGGLYNAADPLMGCTYNIGSSQACFHLRVADTFVTNGVFDRVIIVPGAVSASRIVAWSDQDNVANSGLYRIIQTAALKLKSRGVTPSTTGVTFAVTWHQGEADAVDFNTQAAYVASFNKLKSLCDPYLPGVRWFVAKETYSAGVVNATIQAAQAAVVDNVTVFAGPNMDSMGSGFRVADNIHLNDSGAAQAAALTYAAMHASGSPF